MLFPSLSMRTYIVDDDVDDVDVDVNVDADFVADDARSDAITCGRCF